MHQHVRCSFPACWQVPSASPNRGGRHTTRSFAWPLRRRVSNSVQLHIPDLCNASGMRNAWVFLRQSCVRFQSVRVQTPMLVPLSVFCRNASPNSCSAHLSSRRPLVRTSATLHLLMQEPTCRCASLKSRRGRGITRMKISFSKCFIP